MSKLPTVRAFLMVSLCANALLAAALIRMSVARPAAVAVVESKKEITAAAPAANAVVTRKDEASETSPPPTKFQWSQLDAPDFKSFMENLRSIGCPEATIQDIVRGELREIYAEKRRTLEREAYAQSASMPSNGAQRRSVLEQNLKQLTAEQAEMENRLLHSGPVASSAAQSAKTPDRITPVIWPLALQQPQAAGSGSPAGNTQAGGLSAPQSEAVSQAQSQFVQDIGGPKQNPDDPAYRARWRKAQVFADDFLRAQLGWESFNQLQVSSTQK